MKFKEWPPKGAVVELLKLAGVPDNPTTRAGLKYQLDAAATLFEVAVEGQKPIPRQSYERVEAAARELIAAMNALSIHHQLKSKNWLENQEKAQVELLRVLAAAKQGNQPRKRSRPRRDDKLSVVDRAGLFYEKYAKAPATSYPDGRFATFARRVYTVVGGNPSDDLDHQIRKTAKRMRARRAVKSSW